MKLKLRLLSLALVIVMAFGLSGCGKFFGDVLDDTLGGGNGDLGDIMDDIIDGVDGPNNGTTDAGGSGNNSGGSVELPDGEDETPDDGVGAVAIGYTSVRVMLGQSASLADYLEDGYNAADLSWSSDCPAVVSVDAGIVSGNKVGRTVIVASSGQTPVAKFLVTVEFAISTNGYTFNTDLVDDTVYKVKSLYEANRLIDQAIAGHYHKITIDFSGYKADFSVNNGDFDLDSEFGNHSSVKMTWYPSKTYLVDFEMVYNTDAASYTKPLTPTYDYAPMDSANVLARRAYALATGTLRGDDFDGFAINSLADTMEVYNSEELWWAVEHGYRPTFPGVKTKAELFYERAKMILREIITEEMTEYEKVLSIYDYLVDVVSYDYDAYYTSSSDSTEKNNTCYYLEGVFEQGRAVCDGKTKAFVLLCGIEGIDCVRAFGDSLKGGAGHAWNYVELGGVWYLVDTTEGDARYESSSQIAQYLGGKFEVVSYETFLKPATYHNAKYTYTDMWKSLVAGSREYPTDYFDYNLSGSQSDFVIGSATEAREIFEYLYSYGMPDQFLLTFIPADEDDAFSYFDGIEDAYGIEMKLYTSYYGDRKVYLALFR